MRKLSLFLGILLVLSLSGCTERTITKENNSNMMDEPERKTKNEYMEDKLNSSQYKISSNFDLNIYKEMRKESDTFCISPYSIKDCFSMLYPAVSGDSRDEMTSIFNYDERSETFYNNYDEDLKDNKLEVVNKAYLNKNKTDKLQYDVLNVDNIDFISMNGTGVNKINNDISKTTHGLIDNVINNLKEEDLIVLVNTLYFKNKWESVYTEEEIEFNEKMLNGFSGELNSFNVKELSDNVDLIRLRYEAESPGDNQYSLYVFDSVNDNNTDVDDFIHNLSQEEFSDILDFNNYEGLSDYDEIYFKMPEFDVDYKVENFEENLKNLGLVSPFINTQDFSNISDNIVISKVIHQTKFKVDKDGTEAAASTVIGMVDGCMNPTVEIKVKNIDIVSDFVYVLKDDTNNVILFIGRYK